MSNAAMQLFIQLPNLVGVAGLACQREKVTVRTRRYGFLLMLASNVLWVVWAYLSNNPGEYPWATVWAAVALWNWWSWRPSATRQ